MISVGIIGGSGYVSEKLAVLCDAHPLVSDIRMYGNTSAGRYLHEVLPGLSGRIRNIPILSAASLESHDVFFLALPHGDAIRFVTELSHDGRLLIDLGPDFRLKNVEQYSKTYRMDHSAPELLQAKAYGLSEWPDSQFSSVPLIANPGCYATVALLSALPVVKAFRVESIVINAYSGASGAGRSAHSDLLISEMYGNVRAYQVHSHRHEIEIRNRLDPFGFLGELTFTTHLLPAAVGIYSTTVLQTTEPIPLDAVRAAFHEAYEDCAFVRLRSTPPDLMWVAGTNFCDVHVSVRGKSIVVIAALDNLIKGAAGQAVQNMNLKFGWPETTGILMEKH